LFARFRWPLVSFSGRSRLGGGVGDYHRRSEVELLPVCSRAAKGLVGSCVGGSWCSVVCGVEIGTLSVILVVKRVSGKTWSTARSNCGQRVGDPVVKTVNRRRERARGEKPSDLVYWMIVTGFYQTRSTLGSTVVEFEKRLRNV
jgi:hypothetical protein